MYPSDNHWVEWVKLMSERWVDPDMMIFGIPAHPMGEVMVDAIAQVIAQVPGISEAYIPECCIEGEARQVLVLGVKRKERIPAIMQDLMSKLQLLLAPGHYLDVVPFESSSMPVEARVLSCRIFGAHPKPWWKIW
jgi:hypothetical protein